MKKERSTATLLLYCFPSPITAISHLFRHVLCAQGAEPTAPSYLPLSPPASYFLLFHPLPSSSILFHRLPSSSILFHPLLSSFILFHPLSSSFRLLPPHTPSALRPIYNKE